MIKFELFCENFEKLLTEKISLVYFASGILAIISIIQLTFSKANFQPVLRALTKKKLAKFDRTVERKV